MVELITQWPGHAAEEVERLTTRSGIVPPNATLVFDITLLSVS